MEKSTVLEKFVLILENVLGKNLDDFLQKLDTRQIQIYDSMIEISGCQKGISYELDYRPENIKGFVKNDKSYFRIEKKDDLKSWCDFVWNIV